MVPFAEQYDTRPRYVKSVTRYMGAGRADFFEKCPFINLVLLPIACALSVRHSALVNAQRLCICILKDISVRRLLRCQDMEQESKRNVSRHRIW